MRVVLFKLSARRSAQQLDLIPYAVAIRDLGRDHLANHADLWAGVGNGLAQRGIERHRKDAGRDLFRLLIWQLGAVRQADIGSRIYCSDLLADALIVGIHR